MLAALYHPQLGGVRKVPDSIARRAEAVLSSYSLSIHESLLRWLPNDVGQQLLFLAAHQNHLVINQY